jgi:hypothetical protein
MMQAGDFCDLFDPAMPQPHGFPTGDPPPLLFVESIQQSIELSMFIPSGIIQTRSTCSTTTLVAQLPCHCAPTFP